MSSTSRESSETAVEPDQWVDRYGDLLFAYAMRRVHDAGIAEELVQETFLSGLRSRDQYTGSGSQGGWLTGILKRKIVDLMRRRARDPELRDGDRDPSAALFDSSGNWRPGALPEIDPGRRIEAIELWQVVRDCLAQLPAGQADAFVLLVMEEWAADRVCRELDITQSNLWVRLHRARLGLAQCVGARWHASEEGTQAS